MTAQPLTGPRTIYRPSGSHGFRATGSLRLQLLCVYPAPGGATPGRTPSQADR